ncbi:solute carrier family 23 member 2-like [Pecten maximus]|uniref:solute carrier family 23 member 2-like n=1 Tax=Pecten maximus TaxID=6579 RepID=UPI001457FBF8|nr:solute carrier family 23 member 2-like [Pecten maximus]
MDTKTEIIPVSKNVNDEGFLPESITSLDKDSVSESILPPEKDSVSESILPTEKDSALEPILPTEKDNDEGFLPESIPSTEKVSEENFPLKLDSGHVYLKVNGNEENYVNGKSFDKDENKEEAYVEVEKRTLYYRVSENPPFYLSFLFALQVNISSSSSSSSSHILQFQGSLLLAGCIHMMIGLTGVLGFLMRFIGPITVVPTLLLVTVKYGTILSNFCETSWLVAAVTLVPCLILSMYLDGKKMPIPIWRFGKGFEIIHYPLHQVLSILIGIAIGWSVAAILTITNYLSADKDSVQFFARTDTRLHVISSAPWLYVPYPGQFGPSSFSGGVFISFMVPTMISIIDSIADYYACARTVRVPSPPAHAINRGIAMEGLFSAVAGIFGASHATTTYGGNIGIIGMTKVASRRVFQVFGMQMVIVAIIGKFTAFFVTVPYPVLGAINIIGGGAFIGLVFSNLCYVDIRSTRNLTIIGMAIMIGLMIPTWSEKNIEVFDTGIQELTNTLRILMTSPNLAGGFIACFLDNTIPGTRKERGMIAWLGEDDGNEDQIDYEEGAELYEIPAVTKILRKFRISKYIPIFPTFKKME